MNFLPAPEQRAFADALRELLADADVPAVARSWAAGDASPGRKLWTRLADQGVLALATSPEHGGFGATTVDLVLAFEQLGRAGVPGPYVESVAVLPALLADTTDAGALSELAAGTMLGTVALAPHVPYGSDAAPADRAWTVEGGHLFRAVAGAPVRSVDPARRLGRLDRLASLGPVEVTPAFDLGVLACAAQVHGAGRAVLKRSVAYAQQRRQFGAPIGSFQAVKHQLADAFVGLELARPLLFGAALSRTARDVSAAKVACTDAAYRAARVALQVHGAIGYTAEYDLSIWLLKIRALLSAWGTVRFHRDRVLTALRTSEP